MTRMDKIESHATTISTDNGITRVQYHDTIVVEWHQADNKAVLRSGGWETVTTKNRINQAANQFGLPFHVYQEDYVWYVVTGDPFDWDNPQPFEDGMTIYW